MDKEKILEILDKYYPDYWTRSREFVLEEIVGVIEQEKKFAWTRGASHAANVRFRERFEIAGRLWDEYTEYLGWQVERGIKLKDTLAFPDWLSQQEDNG